MTPPSPTLSPRVKAGHSSGLRPWSKSPDSLASQLKGRLQSWPAEAQPPPSFVGQAPDWPWHRRPPAALPRPGKSREHTHPPAAENGSTHDPSQPNQGQSWDICRGGRGDPISLSPNPSLSLLDRPGSSPGFPGASLRGEPARE